MASFNLLVFPTLIVHPILASIYNGSAALVMGMLWNEKVPSINKLTRK